MQTETPLYVTDILGETSNADSVESDFRGQGQHRRGLALRVADRREAIRKGEDRGDYIAWLALAVLAALILVGLVKFDIATKIGNGVQYEICKITHTGSGGGQEKTPAGQKDCNGVKAGS